MTDSHSAEELRIMLEDGAIATASCTERAAIHLLDVAGLIGRRYLDAYISIEPVEVCDEQIAVAFIHDWPAVGRPANPQFLTASEIRCLELAAGIAQAQPVDLRGGGLSAKHARGVLEALAICLEVENYYTITPTHAFYRLRGLGSRLRLLSDSSAPPVSALPDGDEPDASSTASD
ncbi:hypothetical protein [Nocardia iowensis]|uniref:Uncharacterized protein n=1 Tax=Nocardia iowensis TaxID=204891 RepID=A0ABX8RZ48_NOCIO|nr:hypothetical protein [Nocardia iowensis]QXN94927.1 hypothetical protein KV110_18890 [Nocardia iowensis]